MPLTCQSLKYFETLISPLLYCNRQNNMLLLFSHSGVSDSLQLYGLQHASRPCPSLFPRVCSNSCPLSQRHHSTISFSVTSSPPALNPSQHWGLFQESALCIRWPKYQSFSISPSNEYSGLISLRVDSFDLLAVQGILKSLLQHHSSKTFFLVLSLLYGPTLHSYMTTGKTMYLTIQTFVSKLISLLFNMVSRLVIAFPEKEMATHSSTLAWKITWTEVPGRLQSMGSQ